MIALSTSDRGVTPNLPERLVSRFAITVMSDPTEDSFTKIFSTTLSLEFKASSCYFFNATKHGQESD